MRANFSAEYFAFFTIFAQNPVACAELPHSCLPLDSSAFQPITPRFPSMQKRSPPHRPLHRTLLIASALAGAILMVLADIASRMLIAPQSLPVGVVTALVGVPFFAVIIYRSRNK